mgnify:FL=1
MGGVDAASSCRELCRECTSALFPVFLIASTSENGSSLRHNNGLRSDDRVAEGAPLLREYGV